ncbi:hypothetical protein AVEN_270784-1 [Araneus ventricosus]|uniref:Uncharacterized protein n=1 Tax=Araneus ventricosus TaxID=182803 RepID=A0A4Y2HYT6_ARAVE|nr:hypothetical protein AVEN_270784-1 [Araneus ventricosus]
MIHRILWTENRNGLLRRHPNGLEQIDGECPALSWAFTSATLHAKIARQCEKSDENSSGVVESLNFFGFSTSLGIQALHLNCWVINAEVRSV